MAVVRISDLTAATTPLAGTEIVEIEQGGNSRRCTVDDITAGGLSNPMTTAGDLIRATTGGAPQRLAVGTNGQVLTVVSGAPAWAAAAGGGSVNVQEEGSTVVTGATAINFVGAGVTATDGGGGVATVTIPGGGGSSLTRATFIGGQTAPAVIFVDDTGLRLTAEGSGGTARTARCAYTRGLGGKWYFEALVTARGGGGVNTPCIGVCQSAHNNVEVGGSGAVSSGVASWGMFSNGSGKYHNGNLDSYGSSWTNGDVIMVAVDLDNGRIWWGRNNTWFDSGDPAAGTGAAYTNLITTPYKMRPGVTLGANSDCTFRLTSASFSYSPPSGFSAWA